MVNKKVAEVIQKLIYREKSLKQIKYDNIHGFLRISFYFLKIPCKTTTVL